MKFQLPRCFDGDGGVGDGGGGGGGGYGVGNDVGDGGGAYGEGDKNDNNDLIYFSEGGGLNRLQWFSYSQSFAASNKVFRSIFHSSAVFNPR